MRLATASTRPRDGFRGQEIPMNSLWFGLIVCFALSLALGVGGCTCDDDDDDNDDHDEEQSDDDDTVSDDDTDESACGFGFDLECWAFTLGGECIDSYFGEENSDECKAYCDQYDDSQSMIGIVESGSGKSSHCVCCTTPMW